MKTRTLAGYPYNPHGDKTKHEDMPMDTAQALKQMISSEQAGRFDEAEALCTKILATVPEQPDALHFSGLLRKRAGDAAAAEQFYRRSLEANPDQPAVHNNLGNLLAAVELYDQAIEAYHQATALAPAYADAWFNLGLAESAKADFAAAVTALQKASEISPGDPRIWNSLGIAHKEMDELDQAIKAYERAIELQPDNVKALQNLGVVLKLAERLDDAIQCFDKALKIDPVLPEVQYNRANALNEKGRIQEAIKGYEKTISIKPDYMMAHDSLNELHWQHGNSDQFGASYVGAISWAPESVDLRVKFARSLELEGELEGAEEVLKVALAELGSDPGIHYRLARILWTRGLVDEAVNHLETAVRARPDEMEYRLLYARFLIAAGEYEQALPHLDAVERVDPYKQLMWAYRGLCWRFLGDERDAWLNDYETFVQARRLEAPQGYDNLDHFMQDLRNALIDMHTTQKQPLEQSVQGGTQTPGRLLHKPVKEIQLFRQVLEQQISEYLAGMPDDPTHPFLSRKTNRTQFAGSWSVRLKSGGYHLNHVHPEGWISGPTYIEVPLCIRDDDSDRKGWVTFGESGLYLGPEREQIVTAVKPEVGMCAFFPSYIWHGTIPFHSDEYRMTAPMDAVPT